MSAKMATLAELQGIYGVEDAYDMLEILTIDNFNKHLINRESNRKNGNRN